MRVRWTTDAANDLARIVERIREGNQQQLSVLPERSTRL